MTNKKNRLTKNRNFGSISILFSLTKITSIFCSVFLLLIMTFSIVPIFTAPPLTVNNFQRAINPKVDPPMQINDYTVSTLLAYYPPDEVKRGLGFAMQDNYIFSIIGRNPTIIDVSNPASPTFVAEYSFDNYSLETLALRDNYLYVAGKTGLTILNISDLENITFIGHCPTPGNVQTIALQGDYAYLAALRGGLVIVNISDPTQPIMVEQFDIFGEVWDLAIKGSLAYVTDNTAPPLKIINISDPLNPVIVGYFEDKMYTDIYGFSVTINGSYVYLGTGFHGLFILDITKNSTSPIRIGHYFGEKDYPVGCRYTTENIWDIAVNGKYVFEAIDVNGFYVLDASDPSKPKLLEQNLVASSCAVGIFSHESYIYLQTFIDGICILNLTFYSGKPPGYWMPYIKTIVYITIIGSIFILPIIYTRRQNKKKEKILRDIILNK